MAEQKESSVLFSLKELMNLEEDRIRQEESERRRQADAAEAARADAERRSRDAEEQRLRAEDERRRQEEQRTREETARLEAIRHAEVEKARVEAENAARMEALRRQQEHERQIAVIAQDKSKKNLKFAAFGIGFVLLVVVGGGGMLIKSQSDASAVAEARHKQEIAEQKAAADALQKKLEEQTSAVKSLESDVANAKDEAARAEALAKLNAAQRAVSNTRQTLTNVSSGSKAAAPRPACTCTPGDPLCSCL